MNDWLRAAPEIGAGTYSLSSWLFLRLLGLIYLAAFVSLGVQIKGLVGREGILPAGDFLLARKTRGRTRFLQIPTLCWWNASDGFLRWLCWSGAGLSVLLTLGVAPAPVLALLYVHYLSLFSVGRIFLGYQWDILLLETGFLAIFVAPLELLPRFPPDQAPSPVVLWLLWWLLFRLMFSSGYAKLRSRDRNWRNLTALKYHYETQPLPPWTAWYARRLPAWLQKLSAALMFVIELALPFLVFAPQPLCQIAAAGTVLLMLLILVTGNYCFFNLLGIALAITLLDDATLLPLLQGVSGEIPFRATAGTPSGWPLWAIVPAAMIVFLLSWEAVARLLRFAIRWPGPVEKLIELLEPFRVVNGYGLFSVMTTERPEIIVEGSHDGVNWLAYEFRWKPGEAGRRPRFVAPHQPRLDWQMWFAALGFYENNPWFKRFLWRLLRGSPDVLALLRKNPFPRQAPRYVRAVLYDYRFAEFAERRATGAWWKRERRGLYSPILSLRDTHGLTAGEED